MSIIIKGMEMPKNCGECRFAVDGWCYAKEPTEPNSKSLATHTRPTWCPLIKLKDDERNTFILIMRLFFDEINRKEEENDELGMDTHILCD